MSYKPFRTVPAGSGNLNTFVAGTKTPGSKVNMDDVLDGTLSVSADLTPATNTIQLFVEWQGSIDGTTWEDLAPVNNAATVVAATGTAAISTKNFEAPRSAYGFNYVRPIVRNAVVTGAAGDLYAFRLHFQSDQY